MEGRLEDIDDPGQRAERRNNLEEMGVREIMPAYSGLMADPLGYLWVSEYRGPQDDTRVYTVFDAEGKLFGRLRMPDRFQVTEIGSDYVLGRYTDDLDVEYLRLYRLSRGS